MESYVILLVDRGGCFSLPRATQCQPTVSSCRRRCRCVEAAAESVKSRAAAVVCRRDARVRRTSSRSGHVSLVRACGSMMSAALFAADAAVNTLSEAPSNALRAWRRLSFTARGGRQSVPHLFVHSFFRCIAAVSFFSLAVCHVTTLHLFGSVCACTGPRTRDPRLSSPFTVRRVSTPLVVRRRWSDPST